MVKDVKINKNWFRLLWSTNNQYKYNHKEELEDKEKQYKYKEKN